MVDEAFSIGVISNIIALNLRRDELDVIFRFFGEFFHPGRASQDNLRVMLRTYLDDSEKFKDFTTALINGTGIPGNQLERIDFNLKLIGFRIYRGLVEKLPPKDDFYDFIGQCLTNPTAVKAKGEEYDRYLLALSENLMEKFEDFVLLDFGCGKGRLISAFNNLPPSVLKHLIYFGVDVIDENLKETSDIITKTRFNNKIKSYQVLNFSDFLSVNIQVDYIFMINVLHEIAFRNLPVIIRQFETISNKGGRVIIHDMRELFEGEINFITWEKDDIETLFKNTSFTLSIREYESISKIPLINVHCMKNKDNITDISQIIENLREMITKKLPIIDREIDEIFERGNPALNKRLGYLLILRHNINKQYEHLRAF